LHVFYLLSETPAVAKEKSVPVFKVTEREVSSVAGVLCLKLLRELLLTLVTQLVVRVEFVNAMQSLRVFVVPRSGKRREIAQKEKMSRDAIRQILADRLLAKTRAPEFGVLPLCS
jgi:hypothetical protein